MDRRKASPLRAVPPGEAAPRRVPSSVTEALKLGGKRAVLEAVRDRIARTIDDPACPPAALGALTKRLQEVNRDLEMLDVSDVPAPAAEPVSDSFDASAI